MYEQGMVRMQAEGAKEASVTLGLLCADVKNKILLAMAEGLMAEERAILAANATDMENGRQGGLKDSFLDRLLLTHERLARWPKAFGRLQTLRTPWEKS